MSIYRDSKRIVGTNEDRVGIPAIQGGWKELGRHTASSSDQLDVQSLANKKYLMVLMHKPSSGAAISYKLNNDGSTNYTRRYENNFGTNTANTSMSSLFGDNFTYGDMSEFTVSYIQNISDKEKLAFLHLVGNNGNGTNSTNMWQGWSKWTNTSDSINRITSDGTNFQSGSEMVVLGYDPDDTHTDNFWEELADVTLSSSGALSSGTITAKKYLWVQAYCSGAASGSPDGYVKFNNTGNYTHKRSHNGGSATSSSSDSIGIRADGSGGTTPRFFNFFIINKSADEKMLISQSVTQQAAGATNAPTRTVASGKWIDTSNQITRIDIVNQSSLDWTAGSFIKVWGSN